MENQKLEPEEELASDEFNKPGKLKQIGNWFKSLGLKIWTFLAPLGRKIAAFFKREFAFLGKVFAASKSVSRFRKRLVLGIILGILSLILILMFVFGVGLYKYNWNNKSARWAQKIFPYPAASVGSDVILLRDYTERIGYLERYFEQMKIKPQEDYKKPTLEEMIDQKIIEREAKKFRISVSDKEVEEQYQNIILAEGGEEQVKKLLTELWGFDINYFKELIRRTLLEEKMKTEIPITVHLKHILSQVPAGTDQAGQDQILAKAQGLKNEIAAGKNFAEVAKQSSEDTATKDSGGDLGWLSRAQIETQLGKDCADKIMNLKVGGMDICRSGFGFDIVLVEEKKGKIDQTFEAWFEGVKKKTKIWRFVP